MHPSPVGPRLSGTSPASKWREFRGPWREVVLVMWLLNFPGIDVPGLISGTDLKIAFVDKKRAFEMEIQLLLCLRPKTPAIWS